MSCSLVHTWTSLYKTKKHGEEVQTVVSLLAAAFYITELLELAEAHG
jgi:hypothetical protein